MVAGSVRWLWQEMATGVRAGRCGSAHSAAEPGRHGHRGAGTGSVEGHRLAITAATAVTYHE